MCTLKFMITKDYIDEVTCDVVLMDCTNVLLGVQFFIVRKATIISHLGICDIEKDGQPFILKSVLVPRSTSLVSKVKGKQVIQAQKKFILIAEGKEEELKTEVD